MVAKARRILAADAAAAVERACRAPERRTWPGPLWRGCESRARRCTGVQDALLRTEPAGGADGRPLGAQVRAWGQRAGLAGGAAGHGALGGPGVRGAERRREVPAAGRLPAVAGRAGLLGWAAHQRAVGAQPAYPWPAGTGTSSWRTCAPTPASSTS